MRKLASRFVKLGMALGLASFFNSSAQSQINVDGTRDAGYGSDLAVQSCGTGFGAGASGSSLANAYAVNDGTNLYLFIAGNLETNWNKLAIYLDTKSGGQNKLSNTGGADFGFLAKMNDLEFDTGFEADSLINVRWGGTALYADLDTFGTSGVAPTPTTTAIAGGSVSGSGNAKTATISLSGAALVIDNSATGGPTTSNAGGSSGVTTGVEIKIPLSALGSPAGAIKVCALISNGGGGYLSNQVLAGLPSGTGNLGDVKTAWNMKNYSGNQFFTVAAASIIDADGDGIADSSDPDDDNDGLDDVVETNSGTFVDANNTGSNPLNADTDQDAVNDGTEVSNGRNPLIFDYASMAVPGNYAFIGNWEPNGTYGTGMTQNSPYVWTSRANLPSAVPILFKFVANGTWDNQWGVDSVRPGYAKRGGDAFNPTIQATGYHQFTFDQITLQYSLVRMSMLDFGTYQNFELTYNLVLGVDGDDDEDGLTNGQEYVLNSDPLKVDTDMDGLSDGTESAGSTVSIGNGETITIITSPILPDTDQDGMDDRWELVSGLDPTDNGIASEYRNLTQLTGVSSNPNGPSSDPDGDGVTNLQEYQANPKGDPLAAGGAFAKTSNTIHLTGAFTVPRWTNDPETIEVNLDLVGNFLWKVMLRISSVPTDKNFKFVSDKSWTTSWGKITSTAVGKAIKQDGSSPLVANEISAAGYYLFTLNESTGDYSVIPVLLTDSDGDEIADEWETFYGALLSPAQTNLSPSDDQDSDGQTNLQEYLAGSHPLKDTVAPAVSLTSSLDKISIVSVGASAPALSASDVSATDNVTPSASIQVTFQPSSLDTATAGVRKITYTATDAAGNRATLSRVFLVGDLVGSGAYYNLQGPSSLRLNRMGTASIYGQIYIDGATQGAGAAPAVSMWVGVSSSNTDPATWSSDAWRPANLNAAVTGNNDEYSASINGADYPIGTYYYATRWQVTSGGYGYGGTTGPWNGTTSMNGILTVEGARTMTFAVNMNVQTTKSFFDPASQGVEVRGSFNSWAGGVATLTDADSDGIYTGSFAVGGNLGDTVEYKFYRTGESGAGYEGLADNRTIILGADGVNSTLSTTYFNNDDGIGPVISIIGDNPLNLNVADTYTELGATATDLIDGNRTVTPSGTVNTAVANTYTITYNASDIAGNAGTPVTRTVVVAAPVGSTFAVWSDGATLDVANLAKYAIGGASNLGVAGIEPTLALDSTSLSITAIVRTDDTTLTVVGQAVTNLADYASSELVVQVEGDATGIDQTDVPAGCTKKKFSVARGDAGKKFLRLKAALAP
jgi:hypothetical protein